MCELTDRHQNPDFCLKTLCVFLYILFANVLSAKEIGQPITNNPMNGLSNDELYKKGKAFFQNNLPDSAMVCFSLAAGNASAGKTHNDTVIAVKAYNMLGMIDFHNRNYLGAYSYYKKALEIGGEKNAYWIYNNMAIILNLFKAFDDSEKLLKKTYHYAKNDTTPVYLLNAYSNLINQSFVNDRVDNINDEIEDFEKMNITQNETARFLSEVNSGVREYVAGNYQKAVYYFKRADGLSENIWIPVRGQLDCAIYIAKTFQTMNRPDSALAYLTKAETLAGGHDVGDHLVDIYRMISDCHKAMGNRTDADSYLVRHYALKDSLSSINDFSEMKNLDLRYEVGNYETRILKANLERDQNRRYLVIITVTLLVFAILFVVMIIQNKRLAATNKSLFERNVEILKASDAEKSHFINSKEASTSVSSEAAMPDANAPDHYHDNSGELESSPCGKSSLHENEDVSNITVDPDEQARIKRGIEGFFYNSTAWLSTDFGLDDLSNAVGANKQYVSQVINDVMHTNFYSLLNEHRINEARRRLLDTEKYGGMTIEAIAESIGYKSRSNFSKNFKKHTGLNPKEYIILARNQS